MKAILYVYNSCNIGTSDLPDMYAQSLRVTGLRAEGIHIRQITPAYVTANMYVTSPSGELKSAQATNLWAKNTSIFIGKLTRIDCGL